MKDRLSVMSNEKARNEKEQGAFLKIVRVVVTNLRHKRDRNNDRDQ